MAFLAKLLQPVWQYLIALFVERLFGYIKKHIETRKAQEKIEEESKKQHEQWEKAGSDPSLSVEESQKEQEDAFRKLPRG
jgi:hypothetical protein